MRARSLLPAGLLALALLSPSSARGDEQPEALYEEGKAALAQRHYDEALVPFAKALEDAPSGPLRWQLQLGLALAHEGRRDWVAAVAFYRAFLHDSGEHADLEPRWVKRREAVRGEVDQLDDRLAATHARLSLQSEPTGAQVEVVGGELPARRRTPVVIHLPPGRHTVRLSHPDHEPDTFTVFLEAKQRTLLHKELEPSPKDPIAPAPAKPPPSPMPLPDPSLVPNPGPPPRPTPVQDAALDELQMGGVIAVGAGAASLLVAVGLTVSASSSLAELEELQTAPLDDDVRARDATLRDRVTALGAGATALYVTTGVLVVAGTLMVVFGGDEGETEDVGLGPGGLCWRF